MKWSGSEPFSQESAECEIKRCSKLADHDGIARKSWCDVKIVMNHPATRDPFGPRSPGCCYHSWNPQVYPPCRVCLRPVLTLQQCSLRATYSASLANTPVHQPQVFTTRTPPPRWRHEWKSAGPNPLYFTHPLPSSSGYAINKSASATRLGSPGGSLGHRSPGGSLGQRSPGSRGPKQPGFGPPLRWIGEETKRSLPSHVYKYYLAQTKEFRRQVILIESKKYI